MSLKHRCYKFGPVKLKRIQERYEDSGWKIRWLSIYFGIDQSTIRYHIRSKGWIRRMRGTKILMPPEVALLYRKGKQIRYSESTYKDTKQKKKKLIKGSYEYIRNTAEQQRLRSCQHVRWIKKCSLCGMILESDSINHINSTESPGRAL